MTDNNDITDLSDRTDMSDMTDMSDVANNPLVQQYRRTLVGLPITASEEEVLAAFAQREVRRLQAVEEYRRLERTCANLVENRFPLPPDLPQQHHERFVWLQENKDRLSPDECKELDGFWEFPTFQKAGILAGKERLGTISAAEREELEEYRIQKYACLQKLIGRTS